MALWSKKPKADETPAPASSSLAKPAAAVAPTAPPVPPPPVAAAEPTRMPPANGLAGATHAPAAPTMTAPAPQAEAPQVRELSRDEAQKRAMASMRLMTSFGGIVSVLMRSPAYRTMPLAEVEALVVPALLSGQFLIAEAQSKANGFVTPIAAALWASVSEDVDRRLSEQLDQPVRLAPKEWKSGTIPWVITLMGDSRAIKPMLRQLQETTLKGRPLKVRVKGNDGRTIVGTVASVSDQPGPASTSPSPR